MSFDPNRFIQEVQHYFEQAAERRYGTPPSGEQVEHHTGLAEEMLPLLEKLVIEFCYETSWLEENDRRHDLGAAQREQIAALLRKSKSLSEMLEPLPPNAEEEAGGGNAG